jgi:hypothetical protein
MSASDISESVTHSCLEEFTESWIVAVELSLCGTDISEISFRDFKIISIDETPGLSIPRSALINRNQAGDILWITTQ